MANIHLLEVVQEQSEVFDLNPNENAKIIENQFFDEDGNIFNSMLKSFASGISSIKGSPMEINKQYGQPTAKTSPYCDLIVRTPIDKKKLFGNFKQTSSSLLRKAQAMNKPVHSNRKLLFENPETKEIKQPIVQLVDKENNCENMKKQVIQVKSPIPSIKGIWEKSVSPEEKLAKISSPDTAYYKSPFVLNPPTVGAKGSNFGTPYNGLKGSIVST